VYNIWVPLPVITWSNHWNFEV